MSSQYTISAAGVKAEYKSFFEEFYRMSDSPDRNDEWVQQYTKNGILIMASKQADGHGAIATVRKGMWASVSSRAHNPTKIFVAGDDPHELMLFGSVNFTLKDGQQVHDKPWAARATMTNEGGAVKMSLYQVYLDTGAGGITKVEA